MRISQPIRDPLPAIDSIVEVNLDETGSIASFGQEQVLLEAPAGYAYQVLEAFIQVAAPAGAGSGTHYFTILGHVENIGQMRGASVFGSAVHYQFPMWVIADSEQQPPAGADQGACLLNFWAKAPQTVKVTYGNLTDVAQNGQRFIRFLVRKVKTA